MQHRNALHPQAETLADIAFRAYDVLGSAADLTPRNPAVCHALDDLFRQTSFLSEHLSRAEGEALLQSFDPHFLREFCDLLNRAEEEMEYYWSSKLFASYNPSYDSLRHFIYWDNYVALVTKEYALLQAHDAPMKGKACFVGQGPLPMTMLIYNHLTNAVCCGVDIALRATRNAQRLSAVLQSENCAYVREDGCTHDYKDCDIVFIASLVPVKDQIIEKIMRDRCGKTTYILVRTAEHLSRIYYEPYEGVANGLTFLGKTPYGRDCINTTLLYRLN